jgi:hypothetical protein
MIMPEFITLLSLTIHILTNVIQNEHALKEDSGGGIVTI